MASVTDVHYPSTVEDVYHLFVSMFMKWSAAPLNETHELRQVPASVTGIYQQREVSVASRGYGRLIGYGDRKPAIRPQSRIHLAFERATRLGADNRHQKQRSGPGVFELIGRSGGHEQSHVG